MKNLKKKFKKIISLATLIAFTFCQTGFSQTVTNIVADGRTNTSITNNGNGTYNVNTATVHGNTGFNSFQQFDLGAADTANLNLAANTANLVNMVTGSNKSFIDGTLNAYKNGKIGGNVFFLNPNGIIIGASGIVNVGALTLATPSSDYIDSILTNGFDKFNSNAFSKAVMDGDVPLNPSGTISIKGKINAYYGAAAHAGKSAEVSGHGAQINTLKAVADIVNLDDAPDTEIQNIGGRILITAKKIDVKDGASIKSVKENENAKAGDITILAHDKGGNLIAERNAEVNINNAVMEANNINIKAEAENKYIFEEAKAKEPLLKEYLESLGKTLQDIYNDPQLALEMDLKDIISIEELQALINVNTIFQAVELLTDDIQGGVAKSDVNAKIFVSGGSIINAENDLNINSSAVSQTTMLSNAPGAAVSIGINDSVSSVNIGNAQLRADDINIQADSEIISQIEAKSGSAEIGNFEGGLTAAIAMVNNETSVETSQESSIVSRKDINIETSVTKNINVNAEAAPGENADAAIGFAYGTSDVNALIDIKSNLDSSNDINILSDIKTISNKTSSISDYAADGANEGGLIAGAFGYKSHTDTSKIKIGNDDYHTQIAASNNVNINSSVSGGTDLSSRAKGIAASVADNKARSYITVNNAFISAYYDNVNINSLTDMRSSVNTFADTMELGGFSGSALTSISTVEDVNEISVLGAGSKIRAGKDVKINTSAKKDASSSVNSSAAGGENVNIGIGFVYNKTDTANDIIIESDIDAGQNLTIEAKSDNKKSSSSLEEEGRMAGAVLYDDSTEHTAITVKRAGVTGPRISARNKADISVVSSLDKEVLAKANMASAAINKNYTESKIDIINTEIVNEAAGEGGGININSISSLKSNTYGGSNLYDDGYGLGISATAGVSVIDNDNTVNVTNAKFAASGDININAETQKDITVQVNSDPSIGAGVIFSASKTGNLVNISGDFSDQRGFNAASKISILKNEAKAVMGGAGTANPDALDNKGLTQQERDEERKGVLKEAVSSSSKELDGLLDKASTAVGANTTGDANTVNGLSLTGAVVVTDNMDTAKVTVSGKPDGNSSIYTHSDVNINSSVIGNYLADSKSEGVAVTSAWNESVASSHIDNAEIYGYNTNIKADNSAKADINSTGGKLVFGDAFSGGAATTVSTLKNGSEVLTGADARIGAYDMLNINAKAQKEYSAYANSNSGNKANVAAGVVVSNSETKNKISVEGDLKAREITVQSDINTVKNDITAEADTGQDNENNVAVSGAVIYADNTEMSTVSIGAQGSPSKTRIEAGEKAVISSNITKDAKVETKAAGAAVSIAHNTTDSFVNVQNAQIKSNGSVADISANADIKSKTSAVSGAFNVYSFDGSAAAAISDVKGTTEVNIAEGAEIVSQRDILINANTLKDTEVIAETAPGDKINLGIAAAVNMSDSKSRAVVNGNVNASYDLNINSALTNIKNNTTALAVHKGEPDGIGADKKFGMAAATVYTAQNDAAEIETGSNNADPAELAAGNNVNLNSSVTTNSTLKSEAEGIAAAISDDYSNSGVTVAKALMHSHYGALNINAASNIKSDAYAGSTGAFNISDFKGIGTTVVLMNEHDTGVSISKDSAVKGNNGVNIKAYAEKDVNTVALTQMEEDTNMGLALVYSDVKLTNNIDIAGAVSSENNVNIDSVIDTKNNKSSVSSKSGNSENKGELFGLITDRLESPAKIINIGINNLVPLDLKILLFVTGTELPQLPEETTTNFMGGGAVYSKNNDRSVISLDNSGEKAKISSSRDIEITSSVSSKSDVSAAASGISAAAADNVTNSEIIIGNASVEGVNISLNSKTDIKSDVQSNSGAFNIGSFEGGAALGASIINSNSSVKAGNDALLRASENIGINALTVKDTSLHSNAVLGKSANVGLGAAYGFSESNNDIVFSGKASAGKNINLNSDILSKSNVLDVSAVTGDKSSAQETVDNILSEVLKYGADKMNENSGDDFLDMGINKFFGVGKNTVNVAGAYGYTEHTNKATAQVVNGAELKAKDDVNVSANVIDAGIKNDISGSVKNAATVVGDGAVLRAIYNDSAKAFIANASVDASGKLNVSAGQIMPSVSEGFFTGNVFDDIFNSVTSLLGGENNIINSWVRSSSGVSDVSDDTVAIGGAVNLTDLNLDSQAYINNARINMDEDYRSYKSQEVDVNAVSESNFVNVGGAYGTDTTVGIGGTYNQIKYNTFADAHVSGSATDLYANDLKVRSNYAQSDVTVALSGGETTAVGIEGALSRVIGDNNVNAYIKDSQNIEIEKKDASNGNITVDAKHNANIANIAAGISISETAAIGISGALTNAQRHTNAYISGAKTSAENINVLAGNGGLINSFSVAGSQSKNPSQSVFSKVLDKITGADGEKVADEDYQSGGSDETGAFGLGISGSASINDINGEANAYVENSVIGTAGRLAVNSKEDTTLVAGAGAITELEEKDMGVAIAGAFASNITVNKANSYIKTSNITNESGMEVKAQNNSSITAASIGAGHSSGKYDINVAGSVASNDTANETVSYIDNNTEINSQENINITAEDNSALSAFAGAAAFGSGSVGIGGGFGSNITKNKVSAYLLQGNKSVESLRLNISALNDLTVKNMAGAATFISGFAGVAASLVSNKLINVTSAYISGKENNGILKTHNGISLNATDKTSVMNIAGTIHSADKLGIGASTGLNEIKNTAEAYIKNADLSSGGNIVVDALSDNYAESAVAAAGLGGKVEVVGSIAINDIANFSNAYIDNSKVSADGSVELSAKNKDSLNLISGAVTYGGTGGISGNLGINKLANKASAEIRNNSQIDAFGNNDISGGGSQSGISVKANVDENLISYNASVAGAGSAAVGGGYISTTVENESSALIKDSSINQKVYENTGENDTDKSNLKQSVYVKADNRTDIASYSAGAAGAGSFAVGLASDFTNINNHIKSGIENSSVKAVKDIEVKTKNHEEYDAVTVAGAGSGGLSIAGSITVVEAGSNNEAVVSGSALKSGNNITVEADDTVNFGKEGTGVTVGAVAGGQYIGASGAMFSGTVSNNTKAFITNSNVESGKSVNLNAFSRQFMKGFVPSIGGGIVGIGLSAALADFATSTKALVEGETKIKSGEDTKISASNDSSVVKEIISLAGGGVGAGAALSVSTINNDVAAGTGGGIKIDAGRDVSVTADNKRDISETVVAVAGGYVGMSGSVAVLKTGDKIGNNNDDMSYENVKDYKADIDTMLSRGEEYKDSNTRNDEFLLKYIKEMRAAEHKNTIFTPAEIKDGTSALIGNGNSITAGRDINVMANDSIKIDNSIGGISGGLGALGASVNIADIKSAANAYVGTNSVLKAANNINIAANNSADKIKLLTFMGTGGFIAINAAISMLTLQNNAFAKLGDGSKILKGNDISILANSKSNIETDIQRQTGAALATGATYSKIDKKGTSETYIGAGAEIVNTPVTKTKNVYYDLVKKEDLNPEDEHLDFSDLDLDNLDENKLQLINEYLAEIGRTDLTPADLAGYAVVITREVIETEGSSITPVNSVTVKASSDNKIKSKSLSGTGGAVSVHGDIFEIYANDTLKTSVGDNADIFADKEAAILTNGNTGLTAEFLGLSTAMLGDTGITYVKTNVTFDNDVTIGNNGRIFADNIVIGAVQNAKILNETKVGSVAGTSVIGNVAQSYIGGNANTVIGNKNIFYGDTISISANASADQKADAEMLQGGVAAIGAGVAGTEADINVKAQLGDGIGIYAEDTLNIKTNLDNKMYAETESGKAGLFTIGGALAGTKNYSTNKIIIGTENSADENDIYASKIDIYANTMTDQDSKTSSGNVSLANGAYTSNDNLSNSLVHVEINGKTHIDGSKIYVKALNSYKKDRASVNSSAKAISGLDTYLSDSKTSIVNNTGIHYGKDTSVRAYKDDNGHSVFVTDAANVINAKDRADYYSFSLANGSLVKSSISNLSSAVINFNGKITTESDFHANARTIHNISDVINANITSAGILFRGDSNVHSFVHNTINVNSGADIFSAGNLYLNLSQDHEGSISRYFTEAHIDAYLKSFIPMDASNVESEIRINDRVNIASGASVKAAETIELGARDRIISGEGYMYISMQTPIPGIGIGKTRNNTIRTFDSYAEINGEVRAGYNNKVLVNIDGFYERDANYTDEEAMEAMKNAITVSNESESADADYVFSQRLIANDLYGQLAKIQKQLDDYSGNELVDLEQFLNSEKARIERQLESLGLPLVKDESSNAFIVPYLTLGNIYTGIGDVKLNVDNVFGSGKITASDAPEVIINNKSNLFLELGDIIIANNNNASGKIIYKNIALSGTDKNQLLNNIKTLNKYYSLNNNVTFSDLASGTGNTVSSIIVTSDQAGLNINPNSPVRPGIDIAGKIENKKGNVSINSSVGSINIYGNILADNLSIEANNGNIVQSYWNEGIVFHMRNPENIWYQNAKDNEKKYAENAWAVHSGRETSNTPSAYVPSTGSGSSGSVVDNPKQSNNWFSSLLGVLFGKENEIEAGADINLGLDGNGLTDDSKTSTMIANNIFISGKYLDINGLVQAGISDYKLDVKDNNLKLLIGAKGSERVATVDEAKEYSKSKPGETLYKLAGTHGNVNAYYDITTGEITLDDISNNGGGKLELYGHILNTSSNSGELKALDGYSKVDINNKSDYAVNLKNINVGEKSEGMIKITDLAQTVEGTDRYLETIYTFNGNDIVRTDNTTVDASGKGNHVDVLSGSGRGTDGRTTYNPLENQRYNWTKGNTTNEYRYYEKKVDSWFGGFFDFTDKNDAKRRTITPYDPLESSQYIVTGANDSNAYIFDYKNNEIAGKSWYTKHSTQKSGSWPFEQYTYRAEEGKSFKNFYTHSIKADNPIKIGFVGYNTPQSINVNSNSDIMLKGMLNAGIGNVGINTQKSIDSLGGGAITAANIALTANTGIGNTSDIKLFMKGGQLDAINKISGNVNINAKTSAGSYYTIVNRVENLNGKVKIISDNSITRGYDVHAHGIYAKEVELESKTGGIDNGYTPYALRIETELLKAIAQESINIQQGYSSPKPMGIDKLESKNGDITFTLGADIYEKRMSSGNSSETIADLMVVWKDLGLLVEDGGDWTKEQLIGALAAKNSSDSDLGQEIIIGKHVTIQSNGDIGFKTEGFSFNITDYDSLTQEQKNTFMSAKPSDIKVSNDNGDTIITLSQNNGINILAKEKLTLSGNSVYIKSNEDFRIDRISANNLELYTPKNIYNVNNDKSSRWALCHNGISSIKAGGDIFDLMIDARSSGNEQVSIEAGGTISGGSAISNGTMSVKAGKDIENYQVESYGDKAVDITAGGKISGGNARSSGDVDINAGDSISKYSVTYGKNVNIETPKEINELGIYATGNIKVKSDMDINKLSATGKADITLETPGNVNNINLKGELNTIGNITITGVKNISGGEINAEREGIITLEPEENIENLVIMGMNDKSNLFMNAKAISGGYMNAKGKVEINAVEDISNFAIYGSGNILINTLSGIKNSIFNTGNGSKLTVNAVGDIYKLDMRSNYMNFTDINIFTQSNIVDSALNGEGKLKIKALGDITNTKIKGTGSIGGLFTDVEAVNITGGEITGSNDLTLKAENITNVKMDVRSSGNEKISIEASKAITGGFVISNGTIDVRAGEKIQDHKTESYGADKKVTITSGGEISGGQATGNGFIDVKANGDITGYMVASDMAYGASIEAGKAIKDVYLSLRGGDADIKAEENIVNFAVRDRETGNVTITTKQNISGGDIQQIKGNININADGYIEHFRADGAAGKDLIMNAGGKIYGGIVKAYGNTVITTGSDLDSFTLYGYGTSDTLMNIAGGIKNYSIFNMYESSKLTIRAVSDIYKLDVRAYSGNNGAVNFVDIFTEGNMSESSFNTLGSLALKVLGNISNTSMSASGTNENKSVSVEAANISGGTLTSSKDVKVKTSENISNFYISSNVNGHIGNIAVEAGGNITGGYAYGNRDIAVTAGGNVTGFSASGAGVGNKVSVNAGSEISGGAVSGSGDILVKAGTNITNINVNGKGDGKNVTLDAGGDINTTYTVYSKGGLTLNSENGNVGTAAANIKIDILGTLSGNVANNMYINSLRSLPLGLIISKNVYLKVSGGITSGVEQGDNITAEYAELTATSGIGTADKKVNVNASQGLKASAKGNVYMGSTGALNIKSIDAGVYDLNLSGNTGIYNLADLAADANIKGGNLILNGGTGAIGAADKLLVLDINETVTAAAGQGIYINSLKDMKINNVNAGTNVHLKTSGSIQNAGTSGITVEGVNILLEANNGIGNSLAIVVDAKDNGLLDIYNYVTGNINIDSRPSSYRRTNPYGGFTTTYNGETRLGYVMNYGGNVKIVSNKDILSKVAATIKGRVVELEANGIIGHIAYYPAIYVDADFISAKATGEINIIKPTEGDMSIINLSGTAVQVNVTRGSLLESGLTEGPSIKAESAKLNAYNSIGSETELFSFKLSEYDSLTQQQKDVYASAKEYEIKTSGAAGNETVTVYKRECINVDSVVALNATAQNIYLKSDGRLNFTNMYATYDLLLSGAQGVFHAAGPLPNNVYAGGKMMFYGGSGTVGTADSYIRLSPGGQYNKIGTVSAAAAGNIYIHGGGSLSLNTVTTANDAYLSGFDIMNGNTDGRANIVANNAYLNATSTIGAFYSPANTIKLLDIDLSGKLSANSLTGNIFINSLNNFVLDTVKAGNDVILTSQGNISGTNAAADIKAANVTLKAQNDIGQEDKPLTIDATGTLTTDSQMGGVYVESVTNTNNAPLAQGLSINFVNNTGRSGEIEVSNNLTDKTSKRNEISERFMIFDAVKTPVFNIPAGLFNAPAMMMNKITREDNIDLSGADNLINSGNGSDVLSDILSMFGDTSADTFAAYAQ